MTFGVLFDFTGNSNVSKITKAADMIKQQWFLDAVNFAEPIDLFLLIGHNPIRGSGSTLSLVHDTIRSMRPSVPIQGFGGHTHIRDFTVYDDRSTALESGGFLLIPACDMNLPKFRPLLRNTWLALYVWYQLLYFHGKYGASRSRKPDEESHQHFNFWPCVFTSIPRLESIDVRVPRYQLSRQHV